MVFLFTWATYFGGFNQVTSECRPKEIHSTTFLLLSWFLFKSFQHPPPLQSSPPFKCTRWIEWMEKPFKTNDTSPKSHLMIDTFSNWSSIYSFNAAAYLNLGLLLKQQNQYDQAAHWFNACSQLDGSGVRDPQNHRHSQIQALLNWGQLELARNRASTAVRLYKQALRRSPTSVQQLQVLRGTGMAVLVYSDKVLWSTAFNFKVDPFEPIIPWNYIEWMNSTLQWGVQSSVRVPAVTQSLITRKKKKSTSEIYIAFKGNKWRYFYFVAF